MLSWRLSWQGKADCGAITGQGFGAQAPCSERCAKLARSQKSSIFGHRILIRTQEVFHHRLCLSFHACSIPSSR